MRFARTTRGSLNSGTPLAIASTPVSALQPAEKAFRTSRIADGLQVGGGHQGADRAGAAFKPERVDQADGDDREQADDEDHRRQQEGARRLAETAQVEQRDDGEDARQIGTVADARLGKAEVRAPTPAAIDTATVSV